MTRKAPVKDEPLSPDEIDLNRRETEAGWFRVLDGSAIRTTPRWFGWLGWVLALAALQYYLIKSKSVIAGVLLGISIGLLWLYFNAFFYRVRFKGLPFAAGPRIETALSLALSGALAYFSWRIALHIARLIASQQP